MAEISASTSQGGFLATLDNWTDTVCKIFDRGYDVYASIAGRLDADRIIDAEITTATKPPFITIAPNIQVELEQLKKPMIFAGIGIAIIIVLIYGMRLKRG